MTPSVAIALAHSARYSKYTPPLFNPFETVRRAPSVEAIIAAVCEVLHVRADEFRSASRAERIVTPRHIAMYLMRELTPMSSPSVADVFRRKNHTTVLAAHKKIKRRMAEYPAFAKLVNGIGRRALGWQGE